MQKRFDGAVQGDVFYMSFLTNNKNNLISNRESLQRQWNV